MLRLTNSELDYMTSNCRFVPQVYWEWLYSFRFNSGKVQVWLDDKKHLHITVTDYLYKVTLYEVPILAIISELRNRVLGNNCDMSEVIKKLEPKLRLSNVAGIKFSEFGTRRRFSYNVQDEVVSAIKEGSIYCTGFKPANIVMKLISCQMNVNQPVYGCVKLSDDKGKHTGEMREVKSCLSELGL